jgi:hypothetical protein
MIPTKAGIYKFRKEEIEKEVEIKILRFFIGNTPYELRTAGDVGGKCWHNLDYIGGSEYDNGEWNVV